MIDSIGSFPPKGYFEGTFSDFGEYDECLSVESPPDRDSPPILGKYCVSKVILPYPSIDLFTYKQSGKQLDDLFGFKYEEFAGLGKTTEKQLVEALNMINGSIFQLGLCIPAVCSPQEIQTMLNNGRLFAARRQFTKTCPFLVIYPILKVPVEVEPTCKTKNDPISMDTYQKVCWYILDDGCPQNAN